MQGKFILFALSFSFGDFVNSNIHSYVARLVAPNSPSPKEAAFAGLLVAIAGFFSFSQNLVVDGFGET